MLSPTLMNGYLRAASEISRLAVGDAAAGAIEAAYKVPRWVSQREQVEGAPYGSRGGVSVTHTFPADGDYRFRVSFHHETTGELFGSGRAALHTTERREQIEIAIDGERAAVFELDRWMHVSDPNGVNLWTDPIHVTAGPHRVSAVFVPQFDGPVQDLISPHDWSLASTSIANAYGLHEPAAPAGPGDSGAADGDRRLRHAQPGAHLLVPARGPGGGPHRRADRSPAPGARLRRRDHRPAGCGGLSTSAHAREPRGVDGAVRRGRGGRRFRGGSPNGHRGDAGQPALRVPLRGAAGGRAAVGCVPDLGPRPGVAAVVLSLVVGARRRASGARDAAAACGAGRPRPAGAADARRSPGGGARHALRGPVAAAARSGGAAAGRTGLSGLRRAAQVGDAARDGAVLPAPVARGPEHPGAARCRLHVRQRAARAALRDSRRRRPGVSPRDVSGRRAAARSVRARQRAGPDLLCRPHVARAARQVGDGGAAGQPAAPAPAEHPGPGGDGGRRGRPPALGARAAGAAPVEPGVRVVPPHDGPHRAGPGALRRHRGAPPVGQRLADRRVGRALGRHADPQRRRPARRPAATARADRPDLRREPDGLRPGPAPGALRHARGARGRPYGGRRRQPPLRLHPRRRAHAGVPDEGRAGRGEHSHDPHHRQASAPAHLSARRGRHRGAAVPRRVRPGRPESGARGGRTIRRRPDAAGLRRERARRGRQHGVRRVPPPLVARRGGSGLQSDAEPR